MAYLKPKTTIFIANNGKPIHSIVEKVAFRKYWGKKKNKETGEYYKARKSMPYAICKVLLSSDPTIPPGVQFTIAGYQLRNVVMKGERILAFKDQYIADFADEYGNEWVNKLIMEESKGENQEG